MHSIEEAKISRPTNFYNVSKPAERECGREEIIRAIETEVQAARAHQINTVYKMIAAAWRNISNALHTGGSKTLPAGW